MLRCFSQIYKRILALLVLSTVLAPEQMETSDGRRLFSLKLRDTRPRNTNTREPVAGANLKVQTEPWEGKRTRKESERQHS